MTKLKLTKRDYFLGITALVSLLGLILSLSDIIVKDLIFDLNSFFTIFGVVITAFAFMLGFYFVLLAIRAYDYIREFEEMSRNNKQVHKTFKGVLSSHSEFFLTSIEHQMALEDSLRDTLYKLTKNKEELVERKNELRLLRARLSYLFPDINPTVREKLLLELGAHGSKEDIKYLKKIVRSKKEDFGVKELSKIAIQNIELRLEELEKKNKN